MIFTYLYILLHNCKIPHNMLQLTTLHINHIIYLQMPLQPLYRFLMISTSPCASEVVNDFITVAISLPAFFPRGN